ncbi:MAG: DUF2784 domain-containing protein [Gallionellaceae bacterium]|nr:DUF2784 domain-containing protein [Gallionellaceae bacterium]
MKHVLPIRRRCCFIAPSGIHPVCSPGGLHVGAVAWLPLIHLPAAAWGFFVELTGRTCPLTYLENHLRIRAGLSGYTESFVEHYLLAIIYPEGLTRNTQILLAGAVIVVNAAIYGWLYARARASHRGGS